MSGIPPTGALFSPCRTWRYRLWRLWDDEIPPLNVIGLNPSTADETQDDPTVRRCLDFARRLGHGGLVMTNLFAYRATDPRALRAQLDPIGPDNDDELLNAAQTAGAVIAAWGRHGALRARGQRVLRLLCREHGHTVLCLGENYDGSPKHPLYLAASTLPVPYRSVGA